MNHDPAPTLSAEQTRALLPYPALLRALSLVVRQHAHHLIVAPPRQALPLRDGGVLLSMPAAARDIAIHKLVTVAPRNAGRGLPTILGQLACFDARSGMRLFALDGPAATARRTAALSMLGIARLRRTPPRQVLIIGRGAQAAAHIEALQALHPAARILLSATTLARARTFCRELGARGIAVEAVHGSIPDSIDTVITATSSATPVYTAAARQDRLLIAIGAFTPAMAEVAAPTVQASRIVVDDLDGAREEAGDLILAGIDWGRVQTLGSLRRRPPGPVLFKTVGHAAWDLACCRVARDALRRTPE